MIKYFSLMCKLHNTLNFIFFIFFLPYLPVFLMPTYPSEESKGQMFDRFAHCKVNRQICFSRYSKPKKHFNFTDIGSMLVHYLECNILRHEREAVNGHHISMYKTLTLLFLSTWNVFWEYFLCNFL